MLRCPICGSEMNPVYLKSYAEKQTVLVDEAEITQFKCKSCDSFVVPIKLKHEFQYYHNKAEEIYGSRWKDELVILDEIREYGLFNESKYKLASNVQSARIISEMQRNQQTGNKPKCPTCGSTNIQKISTASKVVGASLFGLLSKNATSQFKCNNCGYKW